MKPDVCFEVSFEAGNKVGGIYTVLISKSRFMKQLYGDNYYAIGFYNKNNLKDFEEQEVPKEFKKIFEGLEKEGIKCYFGKWISASDANLILLDTRDFREKTVNGMRNVDFIKKELWEKFKVDSLRTGFDYDEPLAWSVAAGMFIEKIVENKVFSKNIVCHFHEWLSGGAILHLVDKKVPVATVFTTHATRIGRAKSSVGENLMEEVETGLKTGKVMSDDEAYRFNLEAQHKIEKLCAHLSNVFTAVSEIVAEEAAYVLGKRPDVITINGLDMSKYPSTRTMMIMHEKHRQKINEFLTAYFAPYYPLENMKNNIIFFISGRYEFFNKGVDLFIEGLAELNKRMKKSNSNKTVFAFILIPSGTKGPRQDLLESILRYEEVKDLVDDSLDSIKDEIVDEIINGREPRIDMLIDENFKVKSRILSRLFKNKSDAAPLCAFDLSYDNDMILNALQKHGLNNKKDDKVKVIFYPTYVSVTDGLLSMDYDEFVLGCSMGFFPSKYEPWGYTPFETAALRTLMLTTDVAGFGVELMKECKDSNCIDNRVLRVRGRSRDEIIKDMARIMEWCVELDKEVRVMEKVKTRQLVEKFDWSIQISNYLKAHELAVEKLKSS
jgi:glycogen(starch) synthase